MPKSRYKTFKAEDFAADPFFQKWIIEEDELASFFWRKWMTSNPEKEAEVRLGEKMIRSIKFKQYNASNEDFVEVWNNILIEQTINDIPFKAKSERFNYWPYLTAACFALFFSIGIFIYYFYQQQFTYSTNFNEVATIVLPDSSTVILNGNSEISWEKDWKKERVVHLKGEAFFSVTHTGDQKKFLVYANEVKVEVLGTEFGVKYRRGKAQVVLNSGKVKLHVSESSNLISTRVEREVFMVPGELVEYSEKHQGLLQKEVMADQYSAWTKNIMIFDGTSLAEVGFYIEDNFGYEVEFEEETLKRKVFTGKILDKSDLDLLITILQETFDIDIYKSNKKIIIDKK